ncbi:23S rRNA (guanosine(2251)-2'-O)-methyltransferase RlmB [Shimazuella sp. AN120528]|uniref:23S rRNA (guanosine(2251)-2'-O)-methyltransferase RlmB n=1 Tax=Shimazuella soli TaxID=1892854 RepID=UPI001F0E478C|nr:23S rRNA (guanosine(2251)-2'-O)-methyltransferase RlmB [Shimazuella soli]MCH5585913.1 23S rRNA (guanosine(2251)-2'-O)-methyltransferase RlmB [Shimazuella soli]
MADWIFGKHAVLEATAAGRDMEKVWLAEGLKKKSVEDLVRQLEAQKIPYHWVPRSKVDQVAENQSHQGIAAQVSSYQYASLEQILSTAKKKGETPFLLLLDGIVDPHNLGTVLRTADATGVHGVIIPKRRAVGLTATVAKTSAGAIEYVPVAKVTNINRTAEYLKEQGIWLVGTDGEAKQSFDSVDYNMPVALVIGNEGQGISQQLKKKCDFLVHLPMKGKVSSLNASVATGVMLYQVLQSRNIQGT